ncbi:MAG: FGGY family carbohydrate kinase [Actinomycetota bacterium]|nr:FGGY family carbohydrate kinase [Actinomycetota bacterium]
MADAVIGLDIGTSATKALLVGAGGDVLASSSTGNAVLRPHPGWFEHDAEGTWWRDCALVIRGLMAKMPAGTRVIGVGLSACGPCLVPLSESGEPLRGGILYGVDTRATREVADLQARFGVDEAIAEFGMPFTSQTAGAKIDWFARTEGETFRQTRSILTANGFLAHRLTGAHRIDHHQAAYFAPYYRAGDWDSAGDPLGVLDRLPGLAWSDEVVGVVTAEAARDTGLPVGVPVVIGSSDGLTGMYGAGIRREGSVVLNYGTTLGLSVISPSSGIGGGLWRTPGAIPEQDMLVGALSTAGAVLQWLSSVLAVPGLGDDKASGLERLLEAASDVPAGSNGLLMLPYFAGERTPFYDPDAAGVLLGLRLDHAPPDIFRCALESTAYAVRHLLDEARRMGAVIDDVRAVGGGTASDLWPQIVSDVTDASQGLVSPSYGAPLGAAFFAAKAVGLESGFDALDSWVTVARTLHPTPADQPVHERRYRAFLDAYDATRDVIARLRDSIPGEAGPPIPATD